MQLTLRSARRLEREIEAQVQMLTNGVTTGNASAVSIYQDFDAVIDSLQIIVANSVESAFKLATVRAKIRKAIETMNETSGLNAMMNQEALLKIKAKVLSQVMTNELTPEERSVSKKRHAAMVASGPTTNHYGGSTDTSPLAATLEKAVLDQFKTQAKDIQRTLLKLVDDMSSINTTKTIDISDEDVAFLEANSFVLQ